MRERELVYSDIYAKVINVNVHTQYTYTSL